MKYLVTVQRTEYREHTFEVEANDLHEADLLGMEAANDWNFGDSTVSSATEEVTAIVPIERKD